MSTLKATTLSNLAGSLTISTDRVAQGTAAAWVSFNGVGTVSIRGQYNVSSITDNGGTGIFTVNFATALPDANYCMAGSSSWNNAEEGNVVLQDLAATRSTTSCRIACGVPGTAGTTALTGRDAAYIDVIFHR